MRSNIINDPHFLVKICNWSSSLDPARGIWLGQHVCVAEGFSLDDNIPNNPGEAIINHQLKAKHWSVLDFAFVVLHFKGFPHDTVMQMCRHRDSQPLVQSMRYTGQRIVQLYENCRSQNKDPGIKDLEEIFYVQPPGVYSSRNGVYSVSESYYVDRLYRYWQSACDYAQAINEGMPEEVARRDLACGFRQNFAMAGTVKAVFHWLDQRALADSQIEAQSLAWMALEELKCWSPALFEWYEQNRAGKNLLAP